jgi:DNA-3-methyladenine glycosylase
MYFCFNVTSGSLVGKPEAILVRAFEPIEGVDLMIRRRSSARSRIVSLANGPSKLCIAMGISKKQNGTDLSVPPLFIDTGVTINEKQVIQTTRVNVDYAEEWKHLPWRFFIKDNCFVSKPCMWMKKQI